jgi:low affinity Fe/Cu permease
LNSFGETNSFFVSAIAIMNCFSLSVAVWNFCGKRFLSLSGV